MKGNTTTLILLLVIYILAVSCNAFNHGFTWSKALNSYSLVTGDKASFGDKRIKYNKGFHNHSQLSQFLNSHSLPGFIYEYQTQSKCRGIQLFYPSVDSVYVFEEPKKGNLRSVIKQARKIDNYER